MKRIVKDKKLKAFSALADKMMELGFESMIIIANDNKKGKTYLATKHADKSAEPDFEKTVTKMVGIVGTTPAEMKDTLAGLQNISDAARTNDMMSSIISMRESIDSPISDNLTDELTNLYNALGTRSNTRSTEAKTEAEDRLSDEDKVKLASIRKRKTAAVRRRQYERAADLRTEERMLLGTL